MRVKPRNQSQARENLQLLSDAENIHYTATTETHIPLPSTKTHEYFAEISFNILSARFFQKVNTEKKS